MVVGKLDLLTEATSGIAPVVVRDAEQPSGKRGAAAEMNEGAIGLDECLLRKIVGQGGIAAGEMTEKMAHGGLMSLNEFAECGSIVIDQRSRDQLEVGYHGRGAGGLLADGGLPPTISPMEP